MGLEKHIEMSKKYWYKFDDVSPNGNLSWFDTDMVKQSKLETLLKGRIKMLTNAYRNAEKHVYAYAWFTSLNELLLSPCL